MASNRDIPYLARMRRSRRFSVRDGFASLLPSLAGPPRYRLVYVPRVSNASVANAFDRTGRSLSEALSTVVAEKSNHRQTVASESANG
ncbi:MAG: hypothetical protein AAF663_00460 [Planctomycetota bacterium]